MISKDEVDKLLNGGFVDVERGLDGEWGEGGWFEGGEFLSLFVPGVEVAFDIIFLIISDDVASGAELFDARFNFHNNEY